MASTSLYPGEMPRMLVLRHPEAVNYRHSILASAVDLTYITSYVQHPPLEEAPRKTDCVTAVCYIATQAFGGNFFQHDFDIRSIQKVPLSMILTHWNVVETPINKALCGDILFLTGNSQKKLRHVAICLSDGVVFHSNKKTQSGIIVFLAELFKSYKPADSLDLLFKDNSDDIVSDTSSTVDSPQLKEEKTSKLRRSLSEGSIDFDPSDLKNRVRLSLRSISTYHISTELEEVEEHVIRSAQALRRRSLPDIRSKNLSGSPLHDPAGSSRLFS